mgnify:CR=1 FL=1
MVPDALIDARDAVEAASEDMADELGAAVPRAERVTRATLLDLRRRDLSVRTLVGKLEQAVLDLLAEFGIRGQRRNGAPGVYVEDAKIAVAPGTFGKSNNSKKR